MLMVENGFMLSLSGVKLSSEVYSRDVKNDRKKENTKGSAL